MAGGSVSKKDSTMEELIKRFDDFFKKDEEGNKTLNLDFFNKQVQTASNNIGYVVPAIVDVTKEQVAVINKGLEGVINFIQAFQTANTFFAMMAENPGKIEKYEESFDLNKIEALEKQLIDDVNRDLTEMDAFLTDTFKEISSYYVLLANVIYSEETGKKIKIEDRRYIFSDVYERKIQPLSGEREVGLGLVQIINSFDNLTKKVRKIKIDKDSDKTKEVYTVKSSEGGRIDLEISVLESLKSLSAGLMSSLKRVGFVVEEESKSVEKAKNIILNQKFAAEWGKKTTFESSQIVKREFEVLKFFKNKSKELKAMKELVKATSDGKKKSDIKNASDKLKKELEDAKKYHDKIVSEQIKFINQTVRAFADIIKLWGEQVDNEVHIGQVAGKCIKVIKKLTKLQVKENADVQALLLSGKTQDSIQKTCNEAKGLKNANKVMSLLMERIKALLNFNKKLEDENQYYYKTNTEMDEFKNKKVKEVSQLLNYKYENSVKKAEESINNFNQILNKLSSEPNIGANTKLVNEFNTYFENLITLFDNFEKQLGEAKEVVNIENFKDYCDNLGTNINNVSDNIQTLIKNFNGLKETFTDDFDDYKKAFQAYNEFVKTVGPLVDAVEYIIKVNKKLSSEKIDLKVLNHSIKSFKNRFDRLKQDQEAYNKTSEELSKVMKEVGLNHDYYKDFEKRLGEENKDLLNKLNEELKKYYYDKELLDKMYKKVDAWIKKFDSKFKEYKKDLKSMKTGFFSKLFKTKSYKKSEFWDELKTVEKSLKKYDKHMNKIKDKINLEHKKGEPVKSFCKNSVVLINDLLKSYSTLVKEVYSVVEVMRVVVTNINELINKGYFDEFKQMIAVINEFNEKLEDIEEKNIDLDEFQEIPIDKLMNTFNDLTDFQRLSKATEENAVKLKNNKETLVKKTKSLRISLINFFLKYLTSVYPESTKEGKRYKKMLVKLKNS